MKHLFSGPKIRYQQSITKLVRQVLERGEGKLSDSGALVFHTGEFTGRSPDDKFIVREAQTEEAIDWNRFNNPLSGEAYLSLEKDVITFIESREEIWIRAGLVCAHSEYQLRFNFITETPAANHFAANMFMETDNGKLEAVKDWKLIHAPGFSADPSRHGTRSRNFTVISFSRQTILIGGTGYTGEIKKSVFTVFNYILPMRHGVLPMHCSANVGPPGDTALFFGLSGTGKTTLSSDPDRALVGDDEHGWHEGGIFNFEAGCYAKAINLSAEQEPLIYQAIRPGALAENVSFFPGTDIIDYTSGKITENTRVSYPLHFVKNARIPAISGVPENIFFLSCDAMGVLPPISKLTAEQTMYYYINGYTAKVAGTETDITEPKLTFSACFGAPFLPLSPLIYAKMLQEKIEKSGADVWLINTGWTGGPYGTGERIPLSYTRSMIRAVLNKLLKDTVFKSDPVFGLQCPTLCPGVPSVLLMPRNTWKDSKAYDKSGAALLEKFADHFRGQIAEASQTGKQHIQQGKSRITFS